MKKEDKDNVTVKKEVCAETTDKLANVTETTKAEKESDTDVLEVKEESESKTKEVKEVKEEVVKKPVVKK